MGDSKTTTTNSGSASAPVRNTVDQLAKGVGSALDAGPQVFDKSLYAGLSDETQKGIQGLLGAAGNEDYASGINNALSITSDVASGNRFGDNDPYYKSLMDDAAVGVNSGFLSGGTYGSDSHKESLARGFGRVQGERFDSDVARRERAQANLPGLLNASTQPSQLQLTAGGLLDADAQGQLQGENDLFRRKADAELGLLGQASGVLSGAAGSAGTTSTQTTPNAPWWQTAAAAGIGLL